MKKPILIAILLVAVLLYGFSVPNDVIYTEGESTVKYQEGFAEDVFIGDVYDTGDTITTGFDGFVELDQEGLVLKINPDYAHVYVNIGNTLNRMGIIRVGFQHERRRFLREFNGS